MAQPSSFSAEKTFRSYTHEQAMKYAQSRRDYNSSVYQAIMDHHKSTGGQFNTILDVGCGPGTAVRGLAPHFTHSIGLDPSEGMIEAARSLDANSSISDPTRFEVSTAELLGNELVPPVQDSSIDLITASTAAHWFDMSRFWPRAVQVLKPGGTVAIWGSGPLRVHPSTPNYAAIQSVIDENEERNLKPYYQPGSLLTRNLYLDLLLPWTIAPAVPEFDKSGFFRKEWNNGGIDVADDNFFVGQQTINLQALEKVLGTASPVTRWREAHPDTANTEHDVVRVLVGEIGRLLHEAGVKEGEEIVRGALTAVLLMVKKSV